MGETYRILKEEMADETKRLNELRLRLWNGIKDIEKCISMVL